VFASDWFRVCGDFDQEQEQDCSRARTAATTRSAIGAGFAAKEIPKRSTSIRASVTLPTWNSSPISPPNRTSQHLWHRGNGHRFEKKLVHCAVIGRHCEHVVPGSSQKISCEPSGQAEGGLCDCGSGAQPPDALFSQCR
jgi:hypothetical protein